MESQRQESYPEAITIVHEEFMSAGDRIYQRALSVINKKHDINEDKVRRLSDLGFSQASEVKKGESILEKRKEGKTLVEKIAYYKAKYPLYKFITEKEVVRICGKYGLIYGDVSRYKGFVPDKNLADIERFRIEEDDMAKNLEDWYLESWGALSFGSLLAGSPSAIKEESAKAPRKPRFEIAAPLGDFDTSGMELKNLKLTAKPVPDPVVLCRVKEGYLIVTAWGDEASDPLVQNEINN